MVNNKKIKCPICGSTKFIRCEELKFMHCKESKEEMDYNFVKENFDMKDTELTEKEGSHGLSDEEIKHLKVDSMVYTGDVQ